MGRRATVAAVLAMAMAVVLLGGCGDDGEPSPALSPGVVQVTGGLISGSEVDDVRVYLGVPFAAPPVGDLRWRPPQAPEPWDGVRVCDDYGPSCPQPGGGGFSLLPVGETDEDCLYLNVWAPSSAVARSGGEDGESGDSRALPVMVWIHGGSFATGSGSQAMYSGANLARLGAVVVTINYRLGPLGFLAHPALSAEDPSGSSGNYGLLDQIAALEWVRDNIAGFGGDPENVTVFGESAGGMSVCDLMVSPAAKGLFARGIVQSGPFDSQAAGMDAVLPLAEAEENGRELSRKLGCDEAPDELAALRDVPADRLVAATGQTMSLGPGGLGFVPVVDGVVLPDDPAVLFAAGELHDVDLLVGANADEANLFLLGMPGQSTEQLTDFVREIYAPYGDEVLALFPDEVYGSRSAALSKAVTVMGFVASARFAAASVAETGGNAYLYHFTRSSPFTFGLGAFHSVEIPYVFGNSMLMLDVSGGVDGELSQAMMRYWVSFALDGDPDGPVPADGGGDTAERPSWPGYDPSTDLCLFLDGDIEAGPAPYAEACDLADRLRAERIGQALP